jgi:hypothetical protein
MQLTGKIIGRRSRDWEKGDKKGTIYTAQVRDDDSDEAVDVSSFSLKLGQEDSGYGLDQDFNEAVVVGNVFRDQVSFRLAKDRS